MTECVLQLLKRAKKVDNVYDVNDKRRNRKHQVLNI